MNDNCRVCDVSGLMKKTLKKPINDNTSKNIENETMVNQLEPKEYHECPPDYKELSNSSWTFLHSIAAYYPKNPTNDEKQKLKNLIESTSNLYPCKHCANHMQSYIKKEDINVDSRWSVSQWLCKFHNNVNLELGKPLFDCNNILKRWKDGFEDC